MQGQEFDAAVIATATGNEAADVEEQLERIAKVYALIAPIGEREMPDGTLTIRYGFVHVLYQNSLYASLSPSRRVALSVSVAEALLQHHEQHARAMASELALLFEAGRDFARAADFFTHAARNAAKVYANAEAVTLVSRAINNAERLSGVQRHARILEAAFDLAQLQFIQARFADAIESFDLAERAAVEARDRDAEVRAVCGKGFARYNLKDPAKMQAEGKRALTLARDGGSDVWIASAELVLASERLCSGDLNAAEAYFERSIPVLKTRGLPLHALEAVAYRGALHAWRLEYDPAEEMMAWVMPRAKDIGTCFHMTGSLFFRGMSLGNQGRISAALDCLCEGLRLAELNDERYWLPRLPNTLGWIHGELQHFDTAFRSNEQNIPLAQELNWPEAEANAHVNLGHLHLLVGEPDRALEHLQSADRIFGEDIWYRWRYNIRLQAEWAAYWTCRGDTARGASHAAECLKRAEETVSRKYIAWAHKLLGDIAALEERMEDAEREFQSALGVLSSHPCPTIEWKILDAAARAARSRKDSDAASEYQARATATIEALASAVGDEALRSTFLGSKPVRDLRALR